MFIGDFYYEIPTSIPPLTITSFYYVLFIFLTFCLSRPFKSFFRPYILLISNILFLYTFGLYNLYIILIISLYTYLLSFIINRYKKKIILFISLLPLIIIILFFKYYNLLKIENIIVPLGLSFYTFKAISYLFDIYKGLIENEKNPLYFFNYLLFFPCITAGPINRSKEFFEELRNPREFNYLESKNGGALLMLGIFEKMVMCDYIAYVTNLILNNPELKGLNIILGIILYSFNIYLDFDSYSNIAIGSARLLGFKLNKNFNSPYLASSLRLFWSRWHISLSSFFKDYIYIPLGGNKKGLLRKYFLILFIFLLSGMWHGSTLNFIIWGLLHGLIRIIEDILYLPFKNKINNKYIKALFNFIGIFINFIIVTILWLIFKYDNMQEVINIIKLALIPDKLNFEAIGLLKNEVIWLFIILAITIILDILRNYFDMILLLSKQFIIMRWLFYFLIIIIFLIFGVYGGSFDASDFIYRWF